jgi:hypothetical protein
MRRSRQERRVQGNVRKELEKQKTRSNFDPQGMLAFWGFDRMMNGDFDAHMKRLQSAASEIQEACLQAFNRQIESVAAANQTFAHLLEKAPRINQPKEAMAQASNLMAAVLESASEQSKTWANLARKLRRPAPGSCGRQPRNCGSEGRGVPRHGHVASNDDRALEPFGEGRT